MQSCLLLFDVCLVKSSKIQPDDQKYDLKNMQIGAPRTKLFFFLFSLYIPTQMISKARHGNNIVVGIVVKSKVGDLEEDTREGFIMWLKNKFME